MLDASVFSLLVRLALSLAVVIGLMMLLAAALRKRGLIVGNAGGTTRRTQSGHAVEVIARRGLGRSAQVAVVRAGGRTMVLGVTEHQVTMLGEAQPSFDNRDNFDNLNSTIDLDTGIQRTDLPGSANGSTASPWKTMLDAMRNKTVRR